MILGTIKIGRRFDLIFSGKWRKAGVQVRHSVRGPVWPEALVRQAEQFWQQALQSEKKLFNGRLMSLHDAVQNGEMLLLHTGQTCYRDQLFSNEKMAEWQANGAGHLAARGLGISTVVETADNQIMLIRRSEKVSDHAGFLDVIGGHVHPVEHAPGGEPDVFFAIEDEVRSELGVPVDRIAETMCIGLLENSEWRKPELVFVSRLDLTCVEIEAFSKQAEEGFEYSELLTIGATREQVSHFLEQNSERCTPSAEGSLHLYRDYLHSAKT